MDSSVLAILLIAGLVGLRFAISWVISALFEGGSKAVSNAVSASRERRASTQRELTTVVPPHALVGQLSQCLEAQGWACRVDANHIDTLSPDDVPVYLELRQRQGRTRVIVTTDGDLDTTAAQVLAALRRSDPDARVRPVGA